MASALEQALAALNGGRPEEAEALTRAILAADPRDAAAHQLAAVAALRRGRLEDAERSAAHSLKLRPRHAPTLLLAGEIAQRRGAPAAAWFQRAAEADPGRPEALFKLCLAQLAARDGAAQASLAEALRRFPDDGEGWADVGDAMAAAGRAEAAIAAFARAAAGSGARAADGLVKLAKTLRTLGRHAQARSALERRISIMPESGEAYFLMGLTCEDLGDGPGAVAAYRDCARVAPLNAQARLNLGLALQQAGDLDAALAAYRDAVRLDPPMLGRAAQALASKPRGRLWLSPRALRAALSAPAPDAEALAVDARTAEQGLRG